MTILKMLMAGAAALLAPMMVAAASAADIDSARDTPEDAPAPALSWTGFYLGANAGAGWGHADWTISGTPESRSSARIHGAVAGAQIGYNWGLRPRWILGAEGSLLWAGTRGHAGEPLIPQFTDRTEFDWAGDISARLGYAVRD